MPVVNVASFCFKRSTLLDHADMMDSDLLAIDVAFGTREQLGEKFLLLLLDVAGDSCLLGWVLLEFPLGRSPYLLPLSLILDVDGEKCDASRFFAICKFGNTNKFLVGKTQSTAMGTDLLHSGVNRCGVDV